MLNLLKIKEPNLQLGEIQSSSLQTRSSSCSLLKARSSVLAHIIKDETRLAEGYTEMKSHVSSDCVERIIHETDKIPRPVTWLLLVYN